MSIKVAHTGPIAVPQAGPPKPGPRRRSDRVAQELRSRTVLDRQELSEAPVVLSVMPGSQLHKVKTELLATNVVLDVLAARQDGVSEDLAFTLSLASYGVHLHEAPGGATAEKIAEKLALAAADAVAEIASTGHVPDQEDVGRILYRSVLAVLSAVYGRMVDVRGWLRSQPTACMDTDGVLRSVKLTGTACPSCSINPVVASPRGKRERCVNQQQCGWRA